MYPAQFRVSIYAHLGASIHFYVISKNFILDRDGIKWRTCSDFSPKKEFRTCVVCRADFTYFSKFSKCPSLQIFINLLKLWLCQGVYIRNGAFSLVILLERSMMTRHRFDGWVKCVFLAGLKWKTATAVHLNNSFQVDSHNPSRNINLSKTAALEIILIWL